MEIISKTAGLIYAGGRGARLGYLDKALIEIDGVKQIENAANLLKKQTAKIYISRQIDQDDLSVFGEIIHDYYPDQGPLSGLVCAIKKAKNDGFLFLLTMPVDTRTLPDDMRSRLMEIRKPHGILQSNAQIHPTFSLIDLLHSHEILKSYDAGERRLRAFADPSNIGILDIDEDAISNHNSW